MILITAPIFQIQVLYKTPAVNKHGTRNSKVHRYKGITVGAYASTTHTDTVSYSPTTRVVTNWAQIPHVKSLTSMTPIQKGWKKISYSHTDDYPPTNKKANTIGFATPTRIITNQRRRTRLDICTQTSLDPSFRGIINQDTIHSLLGCFEHL